MGNNSSIRSVAEGNDNHQLPEESKGNDWANDAGGSTHNGWGTIGSTGIKDQGWLDKPAEALHNGWGETASKSIGDKKHPSLEVKSKGWMDQAVEGEYNGWSGEPARQEFNGWVTEPVKDDYNGWGVPEPKCNATVMNPDTQSEEASPLPIERQALYQYNSTAVNQVDDPIERTQNGVTIQPCELPNVNNPAFAPSAPPIPEEFLHEEVNSSPFESPTNIHEATVETGSSSCIICWGSPVEGACVPCGHMAGCMSCLYEIKSKKGDCPICRVKIDQVIKLYAV